MSPIRGVFPQVGGLRLQQESFLVKIMPKVIQLISLFSQVH